LHRTIKYLGYRVDSPTAGVGDMSVKITSLRPGESLTDVAPFDAKMVRATAHRGILQIDDCIQGQVDVGETLVEFHACILNADTPRLRRIIENITPLLCDPSLDSGVAKNAKFG